MKNKDKKKCCKNHDSNEIIDKKVKTMKDGKDYYEAVEENKTTTEKGEN